MRSWSVCGPPRCVARTCTSITGISNWDQWAQARLALPRILGHEAAGEVVAVGADVQGIAVGDLVSAGTHIPCGHCYQCRMGKPEVCRHLKILGVDTDGAFAEYVALPEVDVWKNDPTIPLEFTAIQEPLGNAIDTVLVEDVAGQTVLVTGCGPIGLLAIGIARASGATCIFASEVSGDSQRRAPLRYHGSPYFCHLVQSGALFTIWAARSLAHHHAPLPTGGVRPG